MYHYMNHFYFSHPVMNQCKYTLSFKRNYSWKVAFHFSKSAGTCELYFLDGVFTARDGPIPYFCRYADMLISTSADLLILPIPILLERAKYRHIGTIFGSPILILPILKNVRICRYFRYQYWYWPIPIYSLFLSSHLTFIVDHRESQGIHAAFLLRPRVTIMYRSNPNDQPWLVLNTDLTNFDQYFV